MHDLFWTIFPWSWSLLSLSATPIGHGLMWPDLVADLSIGLSYVSIAAALLFLAIRRPESRYLWVLLLASSFIVARGVTHLISAWSHFGQTFGLETLARIATGGLSIGLALCVWPLVRGLAALPNQRRLEENNAELAREIATRLETEARLLDMNENLERLVSERTMSIELKNRELELARKAADDSNRAKSDFLASMSHEIRTPMNGVLGVLDMLKLGATPDEREHLLDIARDSARSLLKIINDVLDYSKLDASALRLECRPFDPRLKIEQVTDLLRQSAIAKGIELETVFAADLPRCLVSDPDRLRQILMNLVGNAIKFTDRGSVTVTAYANQRPDGRAELAVSVKDTGIGISHDNLESIFTRFSQIDPASGRQYGGTGLGLAISRELVTLMGGTLSVDSLPGLGTEFTFTIRCDREARPSVLAEQPRLPAQTPRLRILVAEDNGVNQMLVRALLMRQGHEVCIVDNGADAVQALRAGSYDLVLMDVLMPGVDGITATAQIRALRNGNSDIPIIAFTASAMDGDRESFIEGGMDDYVSKPIDPVELANAINRVMSRNNGGTSPRPRRGSHKLRLAR